MEKLVIARGAIAGAVAGLLAFVFAAIMVEPVIDRAIALEEAAHGGHDHGDEAELFSRTVQGGVGLGLGMILMGLVLGALFAVAYCVAAPRFPKASPRSLAALLAASMFTGIYLIPFLKYPANPPAVGDPDTIGSRTGDYLLLVAVAVALVAAGWLLAQASVERRGYFGASLIGVGIVAIGAVIALLLFPAPAGAGGFPADDLYRFRLYSLLAQALMWAVIGVLGGELLQRLTVREDARKPALV